MNQAVSLGEGVRGEGKRAAPGAAAAARSEGSSTQRPPSPAPNPSHPARPYLIKHQTICLSSFNQCVSAASNQQDEPMHLEHQQQPHHQHSAQVVMTSSNAQQVSIPQPISPPLLSSLKSTRASWAWRSSTRHWRPSRRRWGAPLAPAAPLAAHRLP